MPDSRNESYLSTENVFLLALTLCAAVVGIYLRLKGLDKAPFTIDEYYIATSVQNIIEKGVPEYDCGGYYMRGIIYQYLLAPFFTLGANDELYARLITVISNILTAPALYLLAKHISGRTVGYFVVILFFLSVWEIEFSRFARMYAPFQLIFIWYLYFLHGWVIRNKENAKLWCYVLSLSSIFIYEGGVFLVALNFLPPVFNHRHFRISSIAVSSVILAITYTYLTYNFRFIDTETAAIVKGSIIMLPPIMAGTFDHSSIWFVLYLLLSLFMLASGAVVIRTLLSDKDGLTIYRTLILALLTVFAVSNAYTLIICTLFLAIILNLISFKDLISKKYSLFSFSLLLMLGFWISYGSLTDNWISAIDPDKQASTKQLIAALFKYPDIFSKVIRVFYQTMPFFTVLATVTLIIGTIDAAYSDKGRRQAFNFLLAILVILVILICILRQPYFSTRYFFFLYPVIILLISLTFYNLLDRINVRKHVIIIVPVLFFMIISEDFLLEHYTKIDDDTIIYRMAYDDDMSNHLYARWDYRSPAELINRFRSPDDIIISSVYASPYYLDRLDYSFHDHGRDNFLNVVACQGKRNLWTNARLISIPDELLSIIEDTDRTVWLIAPSSQYRWTADIEKEIATKYASNIIYNSVDGNLNVYKFPPQKAR